MKSNLYKAALILFISALSCFFVTCKNTADTADQRLSVRMAGSVIKRNPKAWMLDFSKKPKWGYCHGVVGKAMLELWEAYDSIKYYNYVRDFADTMVLPDGSIMGYNPENYNIDKINSGKLLFSIYSREQDKKYLKAIHLLQSQLNTHPRTSEGGFWHKKVYPYQMWLDGLYMGTPFYAQYCKEFNLQDGFDDVAKQIILVRKYLYDPSTGLYKHGWDESRAQRWADPTTGQSPNIWGRGVGWYAMALVDVMDYFPKEHPAYLEILGIFKDLSQAIVTYQDNETGVWYQVMDLPDSNGNYPESTASTMFAYVLLKGLRKGYLDESFQKPAIKAYKGIIKQFIKEEEDHTLSITSCCAGAGLGGKPYRDGSYNYYINEHVRDNDPKAVGPFIMASIEYERMFTDHSKL